MPSSVARSSISDKRHVGDDLSLDLGLDVRRHMPINGRTAQAEHLGDGFARRRPTDAASRCEAAPGGSTSCIDLS